jgi:hypothetical protein
MPVINWLTIWLAVSTALLLVQLVRQGRASEEYRRRWLEADKHAREAFVRLKEARVEHMTAMMRFGAEFSILVADKGRGRPAPPGQDGQPPTFPWAQETT